MHSRNKGKRGELEFAAALTWTFECKAQRGRQFHGRQDAPDVHTDIQGVHFEVKRTEGLSVYKAMEQCEGDAGDDVPVVAHRRNRKPWLVVVKLQDLPRMVELLSGVKK